MYEDKSKKRVYFEFRKYRELPYDFDVVVVEWMRELV